ncbi:hypothetical protein CGZ69_11150 [Streptomyces peucetius subsp. caesius ATCC 27952]|nr:hypothetical protein CGZ69_11150 [Streptomyces peucetius subsp. caesius ATCC 27952]
MDPVVVAAGTALVGAMATDAWQHARAGVVGLWRRGRLDQAEMVQADLAQARTEVLAAREAGDDTTEEALAGVWRMRMQQLLRDSPELAPELRRLLDETLTPHLTPEEREGVTSIELRAAARDHGRVYQAGRDQHITER